MGTPNPGPFVTSSSKRTPQGPSSEQAPPAPGEEFPKTDSKKEIKYPSCLRNETFFSLICMYLPVLCILVQNCFLTPWEWTGHISLLPPVHTMFVIHCHCTQCCFSLQHISFYNCTQKICAKTSNVLKCSVPSPRQIWSGWVCQIYCHFSLEIFCNSPLAAGFLIVIYNHRGFGKENSR